MRLEPPGRIRDAPKACGSDLLMVVQHCTKGTHGHAHKPGPGLPALHAKEEALLQLVPPVQRMRPP